jgi:integrase/recombinase XerD
MILHKVREGASLIYTLFDSEDRVVIHPTYYFSQLQANNSPDSTVNQTGSVVKRFCGWLEQSPYFEGCTIDEVLESVEVEDIQDWLKHLRAQGLSVGTRHNNEVIVREMFKWMTTDAAGRARKDIPWDGGTITRRPHKLQPRFVTTAQIVRLLNGMHNENQRTAAHFMFDTGVRVSEVERITSRHLPRLEDWPEGVVYYPLVVPGVKAYDGSGTKLRVTIISRAILARINRMRNTHRYILSKYYTMDDPEKPIFLNVHGGAMSADSIRKAIGAAWLRQGGKRGEVSPHRLRHGTGYSVLRSELGKDLKDNLLVLKSMLGHSDISTTEIYASIPIAALQSIMKHDQVIKRYEEAQYIYDATYLPEYKHTERRGHR